MKRIFVRALSRSGGTLMCTILDAHPDIAMGYELYEHLLEPLAGYKPRRGVMQTLDFFDGPARRNRAIARRAVRGGVSRSEFDALVREHAENGSGFADFAGRMAFIEKLVEQKRVREGKKHWGAKAMKHQQMQSVFPPDTTYFVFMQRDGRDIAASQKHVGDFTHGIDHIAQSWQKQMAGFQAFCDRPDTNATMVRYEALAADPEPELRKLADFLGVDWSDKMLHSHKADLSIHRRSAGHLSAKQIKQPINTKSIGRYKRDLTADELAAFTKIAGGTLESLGYSA